jgi:hypothetical protein
MRAMGRDPARELAFTSSAAICAETLKKTKQSRLL